ncbi:MAG: hypothetical protein Q7T30_01335, partial [Planctomycetota bacterium]|nr:hypothetical protein [Planctomycetota bacterium]
MNPRLLLRSSLFAFLLTIPAMAQEWDDDHLTGAAQGFQADTLSARLKQIGTLLPDSQHLFSALVARIHGDHREYLLKIDRLIDELADARWQVREDAERNLVEIGGRALELIKQRKEKYEVLEQHIRCARILDALTAKGRDQENRELFLMRGLVAMSLYLDPDPRLLRALRSSLGHTDPSIVEGSIRALGKLGKDDEAEACKQMIGWKGGIHRTATIGALGRMRCDKALAACRELAADPALTRTEGIIMIRALHSRDDDASKQLLKELEGHKDPVLATAAKIRVARTGNATKARFTLPDRSQVDAGFGGFLGDSMIVRDGFAGLPAAELAFSDCDVIDFPDHAAAPATGARVFLNQGSLVIGELAGIDPESVRIKSPLFGNLTLPRAEVQGIALDPSLDRMVGASTEHDRVRQRSGEFVDGTILSTNDVSVLVKT